MHLTDLDDSTMLSNALPAEVAGIQEDLDEESDVVTELEPYGELSVSWMF